MTALRLIAIVLIVFAAAPALSAPTPRPFTGIGVVTIGPRLDADNDLALYQEPGVARVATVPADRLPSLSSLPGVSVQDRYAVVVDKRVDWVQITFDDAGRSGWIQLDRRWKFLAWEDFLKGRPIRLLAGLKKNFYLLHQEPTEQRPGDVTVTGREMRVIQVQDDWCLVLAGGGTFGWIRWRDGDGRIVVSVGAPAKVQNN